MMIGICLVRRSLRSCRRKDTPVLPGRIQSSSIRSGSTSRIAASACDTLGARITLYPERSRLAAISRCVTSSSSTMRMEPPMSDDHIVPSIDPPSLKLDLQVSGAAYACRAGPTCADRDCGLNEPVLDCIANERRIVRQAELLEDPRAVGTDRARAEKHLRGDLIDMLARRQQPHHPVFAIGEQVVRRLLCAGRAYIPTPTDNLADGVGQVFVGTSLIDVSGAAGLEYLACVHFLGQDAQHQDRAPWILPLDFSHQLGAAAAGHRVVEHGDIPLEPP